MSDTLTQLRRRIEALAPSVPDMAEAERRVRLGVAQIDRALDGGLKRGALHEAYAIQTSDGAALAGFAAGLAQLIGSKHSKTVWVRQRITEIETGHLYAPGLVPLGLDPANIIVVHTRHAEDILRAGLEAVRCAPISTVLMEIWRAPGVLDLTTTRRLALAAEQSGVTPLLLRVGAAPQPSCALTRWQVSAAPSRALAANAPGLPAFDITLLRNRAGASGQRWHVEWDHDRHQFRNAAPLSGGLVSVSAKRSAETTGRWFARAG